MKNKKIISMVLTFMLISMLIGCSNEKSVEKVDTSKIEETLETDVIVIGGGGAGLSAAVSASENGSNVILLEKLSIIGGNTLRSGGAYNTSDKVNQSSLKMTDALRKTVEEAISMDPENDQHKELMDDVKAEYEKHNNENPDVLFDCPEWHALQTYMSGDMIGDITLIRKLTEISLPTKEWLSSQGVEWQKDIRAVVGALWERSSQAVEEKGSSFTYPLEEQALKNGVEIMTNTEAEELIMENNKVVGVIAKNKDGNKIKIKAQKGVVMATGGFSANVEMREKYNTIWTDLGEDMQTTNHPGATGDGIIMGEKAGADLIDMEYIQLMPLWGVSGGGITGYVNNVAYVNENGERFVAEDSRRDVLADGALNQPNKLFFIVNDHNEVEEVGVPEDRLKGMIEKKMLFTGNTVAELAKDMGVDPNNLEATIEKFNESVENGSDEFGRRVWGNKIENGPFYASSFSPAVHHTMGGLKVDVGMHVLNKEGTIIDGLYAAGEVTGGIHGTNRVGGNAIPDALSFGRIAGENASKNK